MTCAVRSRGARCPGTRSLGGIATVLSGSFSGRAQRAPGKVPAGYEPPASNSRSTLHAHPRSSPYLPRPTIGGNHGPGDARVVAAGMAEGAVPGRAPAKTRTQPRHPARPDRAAGGPPDDAQRRRMTTDRIVARYAMGVPATCTQCGGRLPRSLPGPGRLPVYCTPSCRQKAYRARGGRASGTTGAQRHRQAHQPPAKDPGTPSGRPDS